MYRLLYRAYRAYREPIDCHIDYRSAHSLTEKDLNIIKEIILEEHRGSRIIEIIFTAIIEL